MKAGDEILFLNGKPASDLEMDDMKAAFAGHTLTLSVSTVPQLDPKVLCSCPPRRSDGEHDTATDIFSQSQGKTSFGLRRWLFHQQDWVRFTPQTFTHKSTNFVCWGREVIYYL